MNFASWLFAESAASPREFLVGHRLPAWTHRECFARALGVADRVSERGRGRNYVLLAPNGPFFLGAYLGTMLGGNTIVPVEPRISRRELRDILASCRPGAVFLDPALGERANELEGLEVWSEEPRAAGATIVETDEHDCAAILYTSGSTGTRKGVRLSHGNLRANTEAILAFLGLTHEDRVLVTLPFSYCYGASLLHTHLRVGGSLALTNPISLGAVPAEIEAWHCTGFAGVPSTYQILATKSDFLERRLESLRYMTQAGGKLEDALILTFARAFPAKRFFVMYGATEATARLAYLPPHLLEAKIGSIGRAVGGVTLELLDERGEPVLPGQVGEIVASGPSVMLGYHDDPQATAEVLHDGKLHTGDLAVADEEGFLRIVGRTKRMIKAAGHRFSPQAVETVIRDIAGVADCSVLGVPDPLLGEAVWAVVEAAGDRPALERAILARCRTELPSYMQPLRVEFVEAMPLNASSKIDLERLRSMLGVAG